MKEFLACCCLFAGCSLSANEVSGMNFVKALFSGKPKEKRSLGEFVSDVKFPSLSANAVAAENAFMENVTKWTSLRKEDRAKENSLSVVDQCALICRRLAQTEGNKDEGDALSVRVDFITRVVHALQRKEVNSALPEDDAILSSYIRIYGGHLGEFKI